MSVIMQFIVFNAVLLLALPVSFVVQWYIARRHTSLYVVIRGACKAAGAEVGRMRKLASLADKLALLILSLYLSLALLAMVSQVMGANPAPGLLYILLLGMIGAMVALCVADRQLNDEIRKYKAVWLLLFGIISAGVPYLAAPFADAAISDFTGLEAATFPRAQTLFVFIMSLVVWPLGLLALGAVALWLLWVGPVYTKESRARRQRLAFLGPIQRSQERSRHALIEFRRIAVLMSLSLALFGAPELTGKLITTTFFTQKLKQALVFSSFHLTPTACGLQGEVPDRARLVQVRLRLAVLAISEGDDDYRFSTLPCRSLHNALQGAAGGQQQK